MPVTLTIIADTAAALVQEFRTLNAETTSIENPRAALANIPLDALIDMVRERLRDDGFKLEIIDQRDPPSLPEVDPVVADLAAMQKRLDTAPEPEPKKKRAKTNGATPETITEPTTTIAAEEDITLPRPKKTTKAAPLMPVEEEADPAGDRQHVLDTLASILKDPKSKDKVLGFASGMAKKHGKDKISELPVDPFPEIRRAMEKEFPNA